MEKERESFILELFDFVFARLISYLCHEYYGTDNKMLRLRLIVENGRSAFAFSMIVYLSLTMVAISVTV